MVPIKVIVPSACLAIATEVYYHNDHIYDIATIEEKRQNAEKKCLSYKRQISRAYTKWVRPKILKVGDLVLKVV